MHYISTAIQDPATVSLICFFYILGYYIVSALCIRAEQKGMDTSPLKKNAPLDVITSVLWVSIAFILLWSLLELCYMTPIPLGYLVLYYFFFIFLFAFSYGLLEWHFPGMLHEVDSATWEGELQYIVLSIQTQTTLGYTRAKPQRLLTEFIACTQALLGLLFCIIFIARAISKITATQ